MNYNISFFRYVDGPVNMLEHVLTDQFESDNIQSAMFALYENVNADESPLADKAEDLADLVSNMFDLEIHETMDDFVEKCIERVLDEADVDYENVDSSELTNFNKVPSINTERLSDRIIDKLTEDYEYRTVLVDDEMRIVIVSSDRRKHGRMVITRVED